MKDLADMGRMIPYTEPMLDVPRGLPPVVSGLPTLLHFLLVSCIIIYYRPIGNASINNNHFFQFSDALFNGGERR
ncbi:MAG: hypothetical protein ACE5OR_05870, partial [bacterium]